VDRLEALVKKQPLLSAILIVLLGMVLGTLCGWAFAVEAARDISEGVRRDNPNDPLDMLPLVVFGYLAIGFCGGALTGLFAGSIVYVLNRKRGSRSLQSR
jgi:hypothetical protein